MKKLTELLTALLLPMVYAVTAYADKVEYPGSIPAGVSAWPFIMGGCALIIVAAALFFIIRANKKKK